MYPFDVVHADAIPNAVSLGAGAPSARYIAGGTDLLQLMKDDVERPARLVDITGLKELIAIEASSSGLRLGALARMSDVADHPEVRSGYPAIAQALLASASPQVRNMGTMGGNLLQRTRCPYFRDVATACNKRDPGSGCSAIEGEHRIHAVLGGSSRCIATHPSDLAVALVAFDAVMITNGPGGERGIPAENFHLVPGDAPERENVLGPGELITAIEVPASAAAKRSLYRKVRDRASFEFALASACVGLEISNGTVRQARVALGGVGTKPWRSHEAEAALAGAPVQTASFERAADAALGDAHPLGQNAFKIPLAHRTLVRALENVSGA
jgi:xanthine dehydrogenase YagS FAD-binding subunit